jgi:hypothetical protein
MKKILLVAAFIGITISVLLAVDITSQKMKRGNKYPLIDKAFFNKSVIHYEEDYITINHFIFNHVKINFNDKCFCCGYY